MFIVMCQPPHRFGKIMAYVPMPTMAIVPLESMWNVARGGTARVGQLAPDFTLPTVDRKSDVRLASFRGKQPVVLVFWQLYLTAVSAGGARLERHVRTLSRQPRVFRGLHR
jgi:hypothetical protein